MSKHLILAAALCCATTPLAAQTVLSGNHSVDGNLCVGVDCTNSEIFGSSDLVIKDNTPRLELRDTGVSPNTDWILVANDGFNAGADYFALANATLGRQIMRIEALAPANSLYVDGAGELGLGTSLPQREIHMVGMDANTIRFEQTGGTPQIWDMLVDNIAFSIFDQTSASEPVRIETGAGPAALSVETGGEIGFGTFSPTAAVHLFRNDGSAKILIEDSGGAAADMFEMRNNGGSYFTMSNTSSGRDWFFTHENAAAGRFIITSSTNPSQGLFLTPTGNMTIGGTLTTGGGTCGGGCDLVFSEGYDLPSISEHADAMWSLGYLPNVGPTPENTPINVSDKLGRMLNELEHAHIYIGQLHDRLKQTDQRDAEQTALIADLQARLNRLETQ